MDLKDELIKKGFDVYPDYLQYFYYDNSIPFEHNVEQYDMIFIKSDIAKPLNANIVQFFTGAEVLGTYMFHTGFCEDRILMDSVTKLGINSDIPTVGFVGRIPIFRNNQLHRGFEDRYNACNILAKSKEICFDVHARIEPNGDSAGYWNGIPKEERKPYEPLFEANMLANQYNLCTRGNSNYSDRFYETLVYGRIPVYVPGTGKLPFDHIFDYREMDCFVWVDNVKNIEKDILEFHETHDTIKCEQQCNEIYWNYFSTQAQLKIIENNQLEFKKYGI